MKLFGKQKSPEDHPNLPDDREGLMAALTEVEKEISELEAEKSRLFMQKTSEEIGDSTYIIEADSLSYQLDSCKLRRKEILSRLDRISNNLAQRALG